MVEAKNFRDELIANARAIVRPGYGILAADESTGTIGQRFAKIDVENTEENRRAYRELLFTTEGLEKHISGVILFEETLGQKTTDGVLFPELLQSKGIIPGIKVDKGLVIIPGTNEENATTGLDGLAERCQKYYSQGARFAKWRAVVKIGNGRPSLAAIIETAHTLARYAAICQANGLVPIVEPEILTDGDHSIEVCAEVSERVFRQCVQALQEQKLLLEGLLLKPNMVTQGATSTDKKSAAEIAWYTVRTLSRTIVPAIPGITFLSGGQSEEEATLNLNEMNKLDSKIRPWALSFSYGRALQSSTLKAWSGKPENVKAAQEALLTRARANSEATLGSYAGGAAGDSASQYVANYSY
ncbi:fructose-bisphosphate aldolase cytoplasmic isozyme-like [Stylonychia lemnae]|uniref:Fructose-bisphosphate aldolase n=1 Tax=Stylonychia lemnae TaxID=5949 RepID=A0A078AQL9_STYLE|nr:fructose-bisphosphate aldolase cytoplasmic isozyme-like [Stylonychia lemnae]|eukprot:CDW83208.1 fructose-bisphosphate aldolase cytoplasmic isozyme-like [Stylonychia lemnae]